MCSSTFMLQELFIKGPLWSNVVEPMTTGGRFLWPSATQLACCLTTSD